MKIFAKERKRWLSQFIDLSEGIPSHQTIARVFALISSEAFEQCLRVWIQEMCEFFVDDIISIDGNIPKLRL